MWRHGGLSGASRASLEGASTRAVALSEPCSLIGRSRSRAAHVTAKAMSGGPCSRGSPSGPSGLRRMARVHGLGRNRRDPSDHAFRQARDQAYLPMVKSPGGRRESEGAVVLVSGVRRDAPGGKGPHFDHAVGGGKRQGVRPGLPGPITPAGQGRPYGEEHHRQPGLGGCPPGTCDNFDDGYGLRPSSIRSGVYRLL